MLLGFRSRCTTPSWCICWTAPSSCLTNAFASYSLKYFFRILESSFLRFFMAGALIFLFSDWHWPLIKLKSILLTGQWCTAQLKRRVFVKIKRFSQEKWWFLVTYLDVVSVSWLLAREECRLTDIRGDYSTISSTLWIYTNGSTF